MMEILSLAPFRRRVARRFPREMDIIHTGRRTARRAPIWAEQHPGPNDSFRMASSSGC